MSKVRRSLSALSTLGALLVAPLAGATPVRYFAPLLGSSENPPTGSAAYGMAVVEIDTTAHTLLIDVSFAGLSAPASAAHIHCCAAPPTNVGVATMTPTFTGFPNATSGTYTHVFDTTLASTFNAPFVTGNGGTAAGAEAALAAGLDAGRAYFNIHDVTFAGGEIRGFLILAPEPTTAVLLGSALAGLALRRRATR